MTFVIYVTCAFYKLFQNTILNQSNFKNKLLALKDASVIKNYFKYFTLLFNTRDHTNTKTETMILFQNIFLMTSNYVSSNSY